MPRMHYNLQKTLCCEHWAQYARYLDVHFAAFLIVVQAQKWVEKTKERKTWIEIRISLAPNVHFATKLASFGEGKTCSTLAQLLNSLLHIRIHDCSMWIRTLYINNSLGLFALEQYKLTKRTDVVLFCLLPRCAFVCWKFWNEISRSLCGAQQTQMPGQMRTGASTECWGSSNVRWST